MPGSGVGRGCSLQARVQRQARPEQRALTGAGEHPGWCARKRAAAKCRRTAVAALRSRIHGGRKGPRLREVCCESVRAKRTTRRFVRGAGLSSAAKNGQTRLERSQLYHHRLKSGNAPCVRRYRGESQRSAHRQRLLATGSTLLDSLPIFNYM